jgi:hypothetical protein
VVDALNYGTSPLYSLLPSLFLERPDLRRLTGIIDNSLLGDFKVALFGKEETYLYTDIQDEPNSKSRIRSQFAEEIRFHDSRLFYGTAFQHCHPNPGRIPSVPYSYIIKELCELISLAKQNVQLDLESKAVSKFRADRELFWEVIFGNLLMSSLTLNRGRGTPVPI